MNAVTLPAENDLAVFAWNYAFANSNWQNDLIAHGITATKCSVNHAVKYQFDKNGNLTGEMEFLRLQPYVDFYKRTKGYILLDWWLGTKSRRGLRCEFSGMPQGADLPFLSPQWEKAFGTLVTKTVGYLIAQGVPEDRILQYPFDEYLGKNFIAVGKILRRIDPELRIFADSINTLDVYKETAKYVDVWCPSNDDFINGQLERDGRLAFLRSTGQPIWSYTAGCFAGI